MPTIAHFIDVGQGNMTLLQLSNGLNYIYDCNIIDDNEDNVLRYVANQIGWGTGIDVFICSHRDADHMCGVTPLHRYFPIKKIWDSGTPGTTTMSHEYLAYMQLRRAIGVEVVKRLTRYDHGRTRLRILSAADERLPDNANAQGIVLKVEHRDIANDGTLSSVMLTGDSDAQTWQMIMKDYAAKDVRFSILVAGHHGSITFFDDPKDERHYYTSHAAAISPAMTVISVGPNVHGHPDEKAIEFYEKYSTGSNKGNKIARTDLHGNIRLRLNDEGGWNLDKNQ